MSMAYEEYMRELVRPMREELTTAGFQELKTVEDVENFFSNNKGVSFVVVNSVCGCAAGIARPAATQAYVRNADIIQHAVTVFAGQDREATIQMREYFADIPASSPSMAILKDGEVVHFIHRENIENHSMPEVLEQIEQGLEKVK